MRGSSPERACKKSANGQDEEDDGLDPTNRGRIGVGDQRLEGDFADQPANGGANAHRDAGFHVDLAFFFLRITLLTE